MAEGKSLRKAVKSEVKEAAAKASTGNVKTEQAPPDLPTGQRRGHLPGKPAAAREPYDGGTNPGAILREKVSGDLPTGARSHLG